MSLKVKISQVVLLTLSDHVTRNEIQNLNQSNRVVGALLGIQESCDLKILSCCELVAKMNENDEINSIDLNYIQEKLDLLKKVNPNYEFLGWYSNYTKLYTKILESDIATHKKLAKLNENPVYLCFDSLKNMKMTNELSIKIYETKLLVKEKEKTENFNEIPYEIEVGKAESISIDHMIKNYHTTDSSPFADHLSSLLNSVKILREKLQNLLSLIDTNENLKNNYIIMKELKEIVNCYPEKNWEIEEIMTSEACENAIITFLSTIVGVNKIVNDVVLMNPQMDSKGFQNMMMDFD